MLSFPPNRITSRDGDETRLDRKPLLAHGTATTESTTSSGKQVFACKSIDKLISDSENPEHRLKKSLGPWSLTALGIGAIIGSGIFVLTGTAAAGEHFEVPSILHAQVLDLIVNSDPAWKHLGRADARTSAGGTGDCDFVHPGGDGLQLCGALLCRTGFDDPHRRQRVHIFLRDARRDFRVDHRLGPDPRICGQQCGGCGWIQRISEGTTCVVRAESFPITGRAPSGRVAIGRARTSMFPRFLL